MADSATWGQRLFRRTYARRAAKLGETLRVTSRDWFKKGDRVVLRRRETVDLSDGRVLHTEWVLRAGMTDPFGHPPRDRTADVTPHFSFMTIEESMDLATVVRCLHRIGDRPEGGFWGYDVVPDSPWHYLEEADEVEP